MIKAISLDWENTCSTGKNLPWPTYKLGDLSQILQILRETEGISFFLNTGRSAPYAEAALQSLGIMTNMPSIAENGAVLYYPAVGNFKRNSAITDEKITVFKNLENKLDELAAKLGGLKELGKAFSFSTNPPRGMVIEGYFQQIKSGINQLGESLWGAIEITHSQSAVDITIRGVNKQSGLEFWCQDQGIGIDELAGVGDSRGDWPVLEIVALPMCPANATPETKKLVQKRGGYISPLPTTLGVIDCVVFASQNKIIKKAANKIICKWQMK